MTATQRYTLLIIDDAAADRAFYRHCLDQDIQRHYNIIETGRAEAALSLWQQEQPDLVLLDYSLPDMDGVSLLKRLVAQPHGPCSIVMITGQGNEAIAVQALKAGAQDYLCKDSITPEQLRHAIGQALNHNQLLQQIQQATAQLQAAEAALRSDRQASALELKRSEQRSRRIIDSLFSFVGIVDLQGILIEVNQTALQAANLSAHDVLGKPFEQAYWWSYEPEVQRRLRRGIDQALAREMVRYDAVIRVQGGQLITIDFTLVPVLDERGQVEYLIPSGIDVTERRQVTAALAESEQRYRTLFNSIDEGFCIIELLLDEQSAPIDYRFIEVNPIFEQQTGLSNPVGKTAKQLVPELEQHWIETYGQVALTGEAVRFEQGSIAMGRCFEVYGCRLGEAAARQVAIVFKDVTARKRDEAEREQLLAKAQSAQEEAETASRIKDEFLAIVSHELRTPLNPILGWSQLLAQGKLKPPQVPKALDTIQRNAKLQSQLIDDLLDISRILRGKLNLDPQTINLAQVVQAALGTVQFSAEAKLIQMHLHLDPDLGPVRGDVSRLQQVAWNLLSNAIKFTPQGGAVYIKLQQVDNQASLSIQDTGQGISVAFLPHAFQRFRQADSATTRQFGGLGLGLAIVRSLVELHGGTVEVDSPGENQGATFTVKLPLMVQGSAEIQAIARPAGDRADLSGHHILVVDGDRDTREVATFMLEDVGATVTAVASAQAALCALEASSFNVILSDIGMPDMDGYALMQCIRALPAEAGGQIQAIALTAFASEIDFRRARAAGFNLHLAKPIEPQALVRAIAQLSAQAG